MRNSRVFSAADQAAFADLSGDFNPMHVDPVAARRTLFGRPVVHGIHSMLWALEQWAGTHRGAISIETLDATFSRPIGVDEEAVCSVAGEEGGRARVSVACGGRGATSVEFQWEPATGADAFEADRVLPPRREPTTLSADEIAGRSGALALQLDPAAAARLFPHLLSVVTPGFLAFCLASTRLVGVECPGMHSLYSKLRLRRDRNAGQPDPATWEVLRADASFGLVLMKLEGAGFTADVTALVRPQPKAQASCRELKPLVREAEFAGQRALVVGGSRGMGEVTAKLLAAGGADVRVTWYCGADDARRVVQDICEGGGSADALHVDVQELARGGLLHLPEGWAPTHAYYFATPHIGAATDGDFDPDQFQRFCSYYLTGFERLMATLQPKGLVQAFYPSSVFVDELPLNMAGYALAKTAGEALCAFLEKRHKGLRIHRPRLPRMATDQTASILRTRTLDPADVILRELRKMNETTAAAARPR